MQLGNLTCPTLLKQCSAKLFFLNVQAFLLNEDLGDSLDSVEALLKKHEDFEKSLSAQEEKITVSYYSHCMKAVQSHPDFTKCLV